MSAPVRGGERKLPDNYRRSPDVILYAMQRPISRTTALGIIAAGTGAAFLTQRTSAPAASAKFTVVLSDEQWRKRLSPDAYEVLRHAGTEPPFSSPLDKMTAKDAGIYACAGCALALFDAKTMFDSGTGWPSFYQPLPHAVETANDTSLGMGRTEVHCRRCGGHLGHVFDDGPQPTGLRYCMNGVALAFHPAKA
jgi:peptide-methionine (R)-S-oxide reductase